MIASWPGTTPGNAVSDAIVAQWDLYPTLVEIGEAGPVPEGVDGVSLARLLAGEALELPERALYWEFHEGRFVQAIRQGDWKAIRTFDNDIPQVELYDLNEDVGEQHDLSEDHPGILERLEPLWKGLREPHPQWPTPIDEPEDAVRAGVESHPFTSPSKEESGR